MPLLTALNALLKGKKMARTVVLPSATYSNATGITTAPLDCQSGYATFWVSPTDWNNPLDQPGGSQQLVVDVKYRAKATDPWTQGGHAVLPHQPAGLTDIPYGTAVPVGGQAQLVLQVIGAMSFAVNGADGDLAG